MVLLMIVKKSYNHLIHPVTNDINGFPELIAVVNYFQMFCDSKISKCSITDLSISDSYKNSHEEKILVNF